VNRQRRRVLCVSPVNGWPAAVRAETGVAGDLTTEETE